MALKDIVEKYKKSINYKPISEKMRSDMLSFSLSEFSNAPNYYKITFRNSLGESYEIDVRIQSAKKQNVLELLTIPNEYELYGNIFTYDNKEWLVYDYNDVATFPEIIALRLNKVLTFKHNGENKSFPCSLVNVKAQSLSQETLVSLPQGKVEVVAQKNDVTELVKPTTRFLLGTSVFEVESVDKESKDGVISFIMSVVNKQIDDRSEKEKISYDELW